MRRVALFVWVTIAAGICGCDESPVAPTALRDVTWKLESIERAGLPIQVIPNPEQYTLRLESDGRANIRADCNGCNGGYTLSGASFSIAPLVCTRAFCGQASLDASYMAALQDAQTVAATPSQLVMRGNGVTLRFRN